MKVRKNLIRLFCLAGLWLPGLLLLAGCAEEQAVAPAEPVLTTVEKAEALAVAEDVLTDMHFKIDKSDADAGLVITTPLRGAQFFEFWRNDNVGDRNALEANLHSIRRIVEVRAEPVNGQVRLACSVLIQRLSLPEHRIASGTRAYMMFSESSSSFQTLEFSGYQKKSMVWADIGDDERLAAEILRRIEQRISTHQKERTS